MKWNIFTSSIYTLCLLYLAPFYLAQSTFLQDPASILHNVSNTTQTQLPFPQDQPISTIPTEQETEIQAFTRFLTAYSYSSAWYTKGVSYNDTATGSKGFIVSACHTNTSDNVQPTDLFCTLMTLTSTQDSITSEGLGFYFNQTSKYNVDSNNATITFNGVPTSMQVQLSLETVAMKSGFSLGKNISDKDCKTVVTYSFVNGGTNQPFDYKKDRQEDFGIKVSVVSESDCELNVSTPLLTSSSEQGAWQLYGYVFLMTGVGLVQLFAGGVMIGKLIQSDNLSRKTAVGTLSFLICFDFYIYLLHFNYWTLISNWMAPIFVAFFFCSVITEPILLYYVFSALRRRNANAVLKVFYKLYFWMLVSGACLIISLTCFPSVIFFAYPFFLLPQIIDSFLSDQKYRWNYWLVFTLGIPKLFYISYLYLVPDNLFGEKVDYSFVVYSFGIIMFELIILQLQTKWPRLCLRDSNANEHTYECDEQETTSMSLELCSICMEMLGSRPLITVKHPLLGESGGSMLLKTPCRHYYHNDCLQEWIRKKLECPNCRQEIPPLEEDD